MTKRMTKEELREDRVAEVAKQAAEYVQRNARWLGVVLALTVVAVVVAVLVAQGRTRAERESAVAMFQAQNLYFSGDFVNAATQFQTLADRFGSSEPARLARLFEGNAELALGNGPAAEAAFRKFLQKREPQGLNEAAAHRGLAGSLAQQGKSAEAAEEYARAAKVKDNPLAYQDWLDAGRNYAEAGNLAEAVQAYRQVVQNFAQSPVAGEARVLLAEAQARSD